MRFCPPVCEQRTGRQMTQIKKIKEIEEFFRAEVQRTQRNVLGGTLSTASARADSPQH